MSISLIVLITKVCVLSLLQEGEESTELPEQNPPGSTTAVDAGGEKDKLPARSQGSSELQPKR